MQTNQTAPNKGVYRGSSIALLPSEIKGIQKYLAGKEQWRDLCLFMIGIDTYLRGCDLVSLTVDNVLQPNGQVREQFAIVQQKSRRRKPKTLWERIFKPAKKPQITAGKSVRVALSEQTRFVTAEWIRQSGKSRGDYLFTRFKGLEGKKPHITTGSLRTFVKEWVEAIGLDPTYYSGHSLRCTRIEPLLEACGKDNRTAQIVLGHSDIRSVEHYRKRQRVSEALAISSKINFFLPTKTLKSYRKERE